MSERAGQRVAAFMLASLFFVSSVAFTAYVVWQIKQDSKSTSQATDVSSSVPEATTNQQQQEEAKTVEDKKLEGFSVITNQVTELQKTDIKEGTGKEATAGATITVHYTGALASTGVVFESSKTGGTPATFALNGLIKGWQDGIPGMKAGGTRRLVIPYAQAYGEAGSPPKIPAKSDLVFDIELIEVK